MGTNRVWALFVCLALLWLFAAPAFAADPQVTAKDLKGISPQRHRYIFSVLGGAALGAGIGVLVGSGGDIGKGILVGGGAASAAYLHGNPRATVHGWREWVLIGSYTALGSGIGWTVCGCDDGAIAGALVGGGASAIWRASKRAPRPRTATTQP